MGGTWVFWGQPNVWREISRYGMRDELVSSYDFSRGLNRYILSCGQEAQHFSHEEEDALIGSALLKLVNVDGQFGRVAVPFPHNLILNPEERRYDQMSVADRLAEIKNTLTPNELLCAEAFVLLCSGATLETTSFYEFLHWWALCGYTYEGCINHLVKYKFKHGQSSFAIRFFREAEATGNMSYSFSNPISKIQDNGSGVQVTTRDGRTFCAKRAISAIPLNVLNNVQFEPPLSPGRKAAVDTGHVNQTIKAHAETSDRDLRSFTGISYPHNGLLYGFGDGETPAGKTHIVAFGGQHNHFHPEDDISKTIAAFNGFTPMKVDRLVFHNWSRDEFAKGAWFFPGPGLLSNSLQDLQERQGNIVFACSDWALGWRSFIDGAIEEGTRAAATVCADLTGRSRL
ncbi:hypothetical protein JDV02_005561 [Purpureocillium takamizusanense]|nr:uncharacterized protein JDV02_005561 [Purpureocillium takamizusanense]UNI19376.1 hypothetical protein JDV02_005561 [Purpureocillium takamizusanense]